MLGRLKIFWAMVRDSLWFLPAVFTLAAMMLAIAMMRLDRQLESSVSEVDHWFLSGGAEGARLILSTIAGSLVTVTGVIFSVTIVGLQLASTQFTPRILRNFLADRTNQLVLGVFISTFTYTLLVLRVVRSKLENDEAFVPHLSVGLAIVLALVSVGFLIHFIHHAARSIQASVILNRVTDEALWYIAQLFPEKIGDPAEEPADVPLPAGKPSPVSAADEGYVQAVNGTALFELGRDRRLFIRMAVPVGEFIVNGQTLAEVWCDENCDEEARDNIRAAFVIGQERTPEQDVSFCIIEIADMAAKALSPGVNDPTTALHCIDRLTQILLAMGKRRPPEPLRTETGQIHFLAMPITYEGAVALAFDQILHFGRNNPLILDKLRRSLRLMEELLPAQRRSEIKRVKSKLAGALAGLAADSRQES